MHPDLQDTPLTNPHRIFFVAVDRKRGIAELAVITPYDLLKRGELLQAQSAHEQSSMPLSKYGSYQKDTLFIFIPIAVVFPLIHGLEMY